MSTSETSSRIPLGPDTNLPKFDNMPGCFDIVRRGNLPGISVSGETLTLKPVASAPHASAAQAPNLFPFVRVQNAAQENGFTMPQPRPQYEHVMSIAATFPDYGRDYMVVKVPQGQQYMTLYPFRNQLGEVSASVCFTTFKPLWDGLRARNPEAKRQRYKKRTRRMRPLKENEVFIGNPHTLIKWVNRLDKLQKDKQ